MIRLTCPGLDPLTLDDWETGIVCTELDLGFPTVREVAEDRPGSDGTVDLTAHHGARVVSVQLAVLGTSWVSRRELLDRLAAYMHPARRPIMEFIDPTGGGSRLVQLRAAEATGPLSNPTVTEVAAQWIAPDGVIYGGQERTAAPAPSATAEGWEPPLEPPLTFPSFVGGGPVQVLNLGSAPANWIARIYGPCSAPRIENTNTGQIIAFPDLAVLDGDYLEVNSRDRTVLLNGLAGSPRFRFLDFAGSSWWTLAPGSTFVAFSAESAAPPAVADLIWRDTWI